MKLSYSAAVKHLIKTHASMLQRCYNQFHSSYINYGGRGITVEDELKDWPNFVQYAVSLPGFDDSDLSLDRIDNNGNYAKGNLKFSTSKEQARNRRSFKRPDLALLESHAISIIKEVYNTQNGVRYVVRCNHCGDVFKRSGKELSIAFKPCRLCAQAAIEAQNTAELLAASEKYRTQVQETQLRLFPGAPTQDETARRKTTVDVGFRSGDWEVISTEDAKLDDKYGFRLHCKCIKCGNETWQGRGKLAVGSSKRCIRCFNQEQSDAAVAERQARFTAVSASETVSPVATPTPAV